MIITRIHPNELNPNIIKGTKKIELQIMDKEDAVEFLQNEEIKGAHHEFKNAAGAYGYHPPCLQLPAGMINKDKNNP